VNERSEITRIDVVRDRSRVAVTGVIRSVTTEAIGPNPAVRCVLADGSGQIELLFLGRESLTGLVRGRRCTAEGRACAYRGRLVIWNPRYELDPQGVPQDDGNGSAGRVLVIGDDPGLCRVIEVRQTTRPGCPGRGATG
jgi:RecG-like helicase